MVFMKDLIQILGKENTEIPKNCKHMINRYLLRINGI